MTKRTRYFMLGSASVLAVGLSIGLVAYFGGFPTGAFSRPSALDELRYVPGDATVVAYANVREVMGSQFRQRFKAMGAKEGPGQEEFFRQTGIDIERDIDYVVAGLLSPDERQPGQTDVPTAAAGASKQGSVVLVRGRFDDAKLNALINEKQAVTSEYRGKRIVQPGPAHGAVGGTVPVLAFMEAGLLAVGDDTTVRRAIDTQQGGENITSNAQMMSLINDSQGSGNAWAVGRFDALRSRAPIPDAVSGQIPPIDSFAVVGHINGGLSGTFRAETRDAESAENLREVVRGFLALFRMQAGSKPEMQQLLQSLQLGGSGTTVALSFVIPIEIIEALGSKVRTPGNQLPQ
jgi:hypothetical protein